MAVFRSSRALLLVPVLGLFALFYLVPIAIVLSTSVAPVTPDGAPTLRHYASVLTSPLYVPVILRTVRLSAVATVCTLVLGYPVALLLARAPERIAGRLLILVLLPFWTSLLVRTYGWMVLLQQRGLVNGALLGLGLVDRPLPLMFNEFGVVIGYVQILLPFMILPIYTVLKAIDPGLATAAAGLGASRLQVFRTVTLPLSLPGVGAGVLIVFVSALGYFVLPALLGGGKVVVVATAIEQAVNELANWPLATALAAVLLLITVIFAVMHDRLLGTERMWREA
jgi:ABC-type spermidine/putrescine transport system permease subunit I